MLKPSNKKLLEILDFILQRKIHIYTETADKTVTIKKGTILNYSIKIPFIQFKIKLENEKIRDFYLNIPFKCKNENGIITFSYKIEDICNMCEKDLVFLKNLKYSSESKLYDKELYINYD